MGGSGFAGVVLDLVGAVLELVGVVLALAGAALEICCGRALDPTINTSNKQIKLVESRVTRESVSFEIQP